MFKMIICLLIALIMLRLISNLLYIIFSTMKYNKRMKIKFPKKKSEYREAFEMECSKEMIKENGFAIKLNKAIEKIDRENEQMKRRKDSVNKKLSNLVS